MYRELTEEIAFFRNQTFAQSTKKTYSTHRDTYLRFCHFMNIPSVPASTHGICLYAAYLARSLKFSSIKQYLGIIGLMHKEFGLNNPLSGNWNSLPFSQGSNEFMAMPLNRSSLSILISCVVFIHSSTSPTVLMLPSGQYVWLPFLVCFANHIYSLIRLEALILISSSLRLISHSFRGVPSLGCAGAKPFSLGKRWCRYP